MADGDVSLRYRLLGEDAASPAFKKAGKSAEGLHTKMIAVGSAIGNLAAHAVTGLGGMAVGAVKTGLQTAAGLQQAQLGFATLLGSEQAAGDYMKWMTGFAASTPFEMQGLVESSRTLIGVGVSADESKKMLLNFGDAASAIGIQQDAFQRIMLATSQAISAGKFQAGDLNQIMTNGLPVWSILSKAMHKTVPELRDMASHGKLLSKDVLPALQAEMHKDYGGAMAKQSQTLNGLWSTFQDTLHLGLGQVLQPLVPILQRVLPGAMDALGRAFSTTADAAKGFIDGVSGGGGKGLSGAGKTFHDLGVKAHEAFDKISDAIADVRPKVESFFGFVKDHGTAFQSIAAGVAAMIAAYRIWTGVTMALTAVQTALDVAMDANPIGIIVLAIAGLVAGLVYAYQHSETFRNIVNGAFGAVKDFILGAVDKIKGAWDTFTGALSAAGGRIGAVVSSIGGWFKDLPGKIGGFLSSLPGKVWDIIKSAVEKGAYYFGYGLGLMVKEAMAFPGQVVGFLQALPGKVWDIIRTLATKGAAAFVSFVTTVAGDARDLAVTVGQKAAELVSKVVAFLRQLPGKAVAAIKELPGKIKDAVSNAGTWLLQAGKDVISGLINGIKGAIGGVISAVKDIGGNIIGGFRDAMDSHSPARKMIPLGQDVVRGIEEGLKAQAPSVYSFLASFAQRIAGFKVTASMRDDITQTVATFAPGLKHVGAELVALTDKIKNQQQAYDDLVKARADYASQLAQGISGGGSIAGVSLSQDEKDADGNVTKKADQVGDFVKSLQAKSDAINNFGANINKLRAEGLSGAVITQIQEAGLETGGALATALASATPQAIQQINTLSGQIQSQTAALSTSWAGEMFDSGVNAAKGLLNGLKSQESHLLWAVRTIAQGMVDEIKRTLKIKSPSGVMRDEVGAMIPAGIVAGIQGGAGGVASAMAGLVGIPSAAGGRAPLGASVGTLGGGPVVNVYLQNGIVGDAAQVGAYISEAIRRSGARGAGLTFA